MKDMCHLDFALGAFSHNKQINFGRSEHGLQALKHSANYLMTNFDRITTARSRNLSARIGSKSLFENTDTL